MCSQDHTSLMQPFLYFSVMCLVYVQEVWSCYLVVFEISELCWFGVNQIWGQIMHLFLSSTEPFNWLYQVLIFNLSVMINTVLHSTSLTLPYLIWFDWFALEPSVHVRAPADSRGFVDKPRPIGRGGRRWLQGFPLILMAFTRSFIKIFCSWARGYCTQAG